MPGWLPACLPTVGTTPPALAPLDPSFRTVQPGDPDRYTPAGYDDAGRHICADCKVPVSGLLSTARLALLALASLFRINGPSEIGPWNRLRTAIQDST